ncbi:MAG: hypothetical protein WBI41_00560 [Azovibrio sp.]|uniref:hypothetical protein n=1 Tax=Azovibrio sp. TaxID=1872673 RepID=UPI003C77AE30
MAWWLGSCGGVAAACLAQRILVCFCAAERIEPVSGRTGLLPAALSGVIRHDSGMMRV